MEVVGMIRQQERRSSAVEWVESRVLLSQAAHGLALGHYKHDDAATGAAYAEPSSGKWKDDQSASRGERSHDENQDDTPKLKHEKQADVADEHGHEHEHEHGDDDRRSASNGATATTSSPTDELTDHGTNLPQPGSADADPSPHSDDGSDPVRHDSSNTNDSSSTPTRIPVAAIELPGGVTVVVPVAVP